MGFEDFLPLLVGGLGGALGGTSNPELTPEQQKLWKEWWERYQAQKADANSPFLGGKLGSWEQTNLANQAKQLSQVQGRNMEAVYGSQSATDLGNPSQADQQKNIYQANTAQQSALYANAAQQGLARRDAMRQSLPSYLQGMGGLANNPGIPAQNTGIPPQLLQMFGQMWGQRGSNPYGSSGGRTVNGQSVDQYGNATQQSPGMGGGSIPIGQWGGGGTTVNQVGASGSGGWEDWPNWPKPR